MSLARKIFIGIGLALAGLVAVVLVKTWATPSRQISVPPQKPVAVDQAAAAARLGAAVQLRTISSYADPKANLAEFERLHALLEQSFPAAHQVLKKEVVGEATLLYSWAGSDPAAKPIAILAHQDVVPIADGTEKDWAQPPFSGAIADGFVWGRGAWDNKGNLMSVMEAVEMLAASGFKPRQTVYLVFGHDEEVTGQRGAAKVAALFKQRGVRLEFVIDEGLLITHNLVPGVKQPLALIGIAEKGYLTLLLQAKAPPGHSSMPPSRPGQTAIGMMSAALARLEDQQMPAGLRDLSSEMFSTIAPEMDGVNRVVLSNLWLFKPVVEWQLQQAPSTNATVRTTTALTVMNAGNKDNVLPGRAQALVNFRIIPGETSEDVMRHTLLVVGNPNISVEKDPQIAMSEPSKVSRTDAPGYQLINRTLRQLHPDVLVSPGLMTAATDSRYFDAVADNVYKFAPVHAAAADLSRFHGTNERISLANYAELIQFYHQLLRNASAPQ